MKRCLISKDLLTNKTLLQSLILIILFVIYGNGCPSQQYIWPSGDAVKLDCPIGWSVGYDRLVWKYQAYSGWRFFFSCYLPLCTSGLFQGEFLRLTNPKEYYNSTSSSVSVILTNIKAGRLNISCSVQGYSESRTNCVWGIFATENKLTSTHSPLRFTSSLSTSTISTTTEPRNVCLLSECDMTSVHYKTVYRGEPFNVSVSAFDSSSTDWLVCDQRRTRQVGHCSRSTITGYIWCSNTVDSDYNRDLKSRLESRSHAIFLIVDEIRGDVTELQVLCVQNNTYYKTNMLWKIYITDTEDEPVRHTTTHGFDLKDHYESTVLPIIIVVPTSALTLVLIIVCTVRYRRRAASRRGASSSPPRVVSSNRYQVTSPRAVSYTPPTDQVSLWLTTISARIQHASATRDVASPPPYDEPPPYDSLSLTGFHARDVSLSTLTLLHDGISESNVSDPPPPYPGIHTEI